MKAPKAPNGTLPGLQGILRAYRACMEQQKACEGLAASNNQNTFSIVMQTL